MADGERPLAANLRAARTRAGLSVVELARQAKIARATLTQLEAGSGNPTLETLYALADELGVPLADLIAGPEASLGPRVVRGGEGPRTRGAVVEARLLRRDHHVGRILEIYAVTLHAGPDQHSRGHPSGTREHLHLHAGAALVGPAGGPIALAAGDYVDYPADVEHVYRATSDDPAHGTLVIVTPERGSPRPVV